MKALSSQKRLCRLEKLQRKELIMMPAQPGLEVSSPWTYREKLLNPLAVGIRSRC